MTFAMGQDGLTRILLVILILVVPLLCRQAFCFDYFHSSMSPDCKECTCAGDDLLQPSSGHLCCPICNKDVKPVTCAFVGCAWMYDGRMLGANDNIISCSSDWQVHDQIGSPSA